MTQEKRAHLKKKTVCASPRHTNVLNKYDHLKLLSPFLPHTSPFPTQTSAPGLGNDRTAVRHLCPPRVFQVHFPTSLPAQPPLPASKRLKEGEEIGRHQSSGGGRLLELFFAVTQIAQSDLSLSSASENLPNPYPHSRPHLPKESLEH